MANTKVDRITDEMINAYKKVYGNDLIKVLLYGSYARGDYNDYSDIDIVAIVKGDRTTIQSKLSEIDDYASDIGLENDVIISPNAIPFNEFEEYKDILPYYNNIYKEGIPIWIS